MRKTYKENPEIRKETETMEMDIGKVLVERTGGKMIDEEEIVIKGINLKIKARADMMTEERIGLEKGGPMTGTERVIGRVKIGKKGLDRKTGKSGVISMMITVGNMTIAIREKMTEDGKRRMA